MPKTKAPELIRFGENVRKRREERACVALFLEFTDTVLNKSACAKAHAVEVGATLRVQFHPHADWYFIITNAEGYYDTPRGKFHDLYVRSKRTTMYACPQMTVNSLKEKPTLLVPC